MGHGNAWGNRCISSRSFDYVRCGGFRSEIFVVIGRNDLSGNAQMSLVVMKFGGTSVEDPAAIERTASIVAGRVSLGRHPVVVVSAMAKVTDQLLRAAAAASVGDRTGALAISSRLRSRHRDTAAALVKNPKDSAALISWID